MGGSAFVPAHVTAFFSPRWGDDSAASGATGAGIALAHGVEVDVEPAGATSVSINGQPVAMEPVERALAALDQPGAVAVETPLPLGAGFGVSGAATLGAALAADAAAGGGRSENELVAAAHSAEVEAGTGLGDVVAQARGGVPIRLAPGDPEHGRLDGVPAAGRVEYLTAGEIDTRSVLGGDTAALAAAGDSALADLRESPTLPTLFSAGRTFAGEADLLTERVAAVVEAVRESGGEATMAMLGETVVALGTGLSDAGYDATATRVYHGGAALGAADRENR